jgi:hypothetical protein
MQFRPRRLACAVSLASLGLANTAPHALAQTNEGTEEIYVYGQIGAAQSAVAQKPQPTTFGRYSMWSAPASSPIRTWPRPLAACPVWVW